MIWRFIVIMGCLLSNLSAVHYQFYHEPIDVVIPCAEKDLETLNLCIAGIKKNCTQVRRVIVVSSRRLTDQAEWFNEAGYPFSKEDVWHHLAPGKKISSRVGWYFAQLLKLYAPMVIPGISTNALIIDADTIFLNPVTFLNERLEGLYNPGTECHLPYFEHASRLLPGVRRLYPQYSGISHHMLFQYSVMQDLFSYVENFHHKPFWQAFCSCVDPEHVEGSGAADYEIYFNFVFSRTNQVHIRPLKWKNVDSLKELARYQAKGYHYISCHSYLRGEQ
jgi:hypothetical protein